MSKFQALGNFAHFCCCHFGFNRLGKETSLSANATATVAATTATATATAASAKPPSFQL